MPFRVGKRTRIFRTRKRADHPYALRGIFYGKCQPYRVKSCLRSKVFLFQKRKRDAVVDDIIAKIALSAYRKVFALPVRQDRSAGSKSADAGRPHRTLCRHHKRDPSVNDKRAVCIIPFKKLVPVEFKRRRIAQHVRAFHANACTELFLRFLLNTTVLMGSLACLT